MDMGDLTQSSFMVGETLEKERKRSHRKLLTKHLLDFGSNTTLHGLRYVTDTRLSLVEKIFWLVTFLTSIGICCYWIHSVWTKWQDTPVIVTFNERLEPVGSVPFPSVTICPQLVIKATELNYTDIRGKFVYDDEAYANLSSETKRIFEHVTFVCKDNEVSYLLRHKHTNASLVKDMLKVAPGVKEIFFTCLWKGVIRKCRTLFKMVLTEEGVCYNMNSLPIHDILRNDSIHHNYEYMGTIPDEQIRGWTEDGYYDPDEKDSYPRRAQGFGSSTELSIMFYYLDDYQDKICNSFNTGYKVFVHQPQDMPRSSMNYYSVTKNMNSYFGLTFSILNSSDNLRSVSPEARQCYFPGERDLRYFKIYSASNCELECLANRTMELCHCVFFYMPYETSDKLCRSNGDKCMHDVQESLANNSCNCLPSCNSIEYEADIAKISYKLAEYYKTLIKPIETTKTAELENSFLVEYELYMEELSGFGHFSALDMYYKRPRYIAMRRSLLFGTADFLSNCGGLLGLFLGFSFLSLVEIIYFLSLRLWFALKREVKEEKEKRQE